MNIKRMADEYRAQVMSTGKSLRNDINQHLLPDSHRKILIGEYRTNIRRWYNHLLRALSSEKDLKELMRVYMLLVKLSKLCGKNTENLYTKRRVVVEEIQKHMERFLEKLPHLIEKSLTRAVRESGIRLR